MQQSLQLLVESLRQASLLMHADDLSAECEIASIVHDTREVQAGSLFVCIRGAKADGHQLLRVAVEKGARAAVVEDRLLIEDGLKIPLLQVSDSRASLAVLADAFYSSPSKKLLMVGVTGTNGKTSTSWAIAQVLSLLGKPCGYGGTFGLATPKQLHAAESDHYLALARFQQTNNSSPDSLILQKFLAGLVECGGVAASLEATSQGIAQKRTKSLDWDAVVFTNLTRDHLDLHGTMENYFSLKQELFTEELRCSSKNNRVAVVNADDEWGQKLASSLSSLPGIRLIRYSRKQNGGEVFLKSSKLSISGSELECELDGKAVKLRYRLIGDYNVENMLATASTLFGLGIPLSDIERFFPEIPPVPGRIEIVDGGESDISVVVDYAHTPDGLIQVQRSLRPLCPGRLLTVFGCGGDRDRGKRPMMAHAVKEWSDGAFVTSDNPRTEDPGRIIEDILPGFGSAECVPGAFELVVVADRRKAIEEAVLQARPGDTILVAGKGHEDYQDIHGVKHPFLDVEVCKEALLLRRRKLSLGQS